MIDNKKRRFYVGSENIHNALMIIRNSNRYMDDSFVKSLDDAIEDAKSYLEENSSCEARYIVEIVKIVKRETVPIVVKDFLKK